MFIIDIRRDCEPKLTFTFKPTSLVIFSDFHLLQALFVAG